MTLNVDAPEMLNISRKGSAYSYIELQPGENTVKFNPLTDNSLIIKARNYNGMIYKVEADGVEIPLTSNSSGMSCEAPIKEGSVVNVTYKYPPLDCVVKVELPEGVGTDIFRSVYTTKDDQRDDLLADTEYYLDVATYINFEINTDNYKLEGLTFNGKNLYEEWTTTYRLPITEAENTVSIAAHRYADITAKLVISDPSQVKVYKGYSYNYDEITDLQAGENTISVPEKTAGISIKAADGAYISSITDNEGNSYSEDSLIKFATDGSSVITVESGVFSTDPAEISINVPEGVDLSDVVCAVLVDSKRVELDGNKFTGLPGKYFSLIFNSYDYDVTSADITVEGGNTSSLMSSYGGISGATIFGNSVIDLVVTKKPQTITFNVSIDNPEAVTVYRNYSTWNPTVSWTVALKAGDNTLNWAADDYYNRITIVANDGYALESVLNVDEDFEMDPTSFQPSDGMNIAIKTSKIERDSKAVIFLADYEDLEYNWGSFSFLNAMGGAIAPFTAGYSDGYALFEFSSTAENPFQVTAEGDAWSGVSIIDSPVYVNDQPVSNEGYYGGFKASLELKDGDVVKAFFLTEPARCKVSFKAPSEEVCVVKRDILTPVDLTSEIEVFEGTRFDIVPLADNEVNVLVNGELLTDQDGVYSFVVNSDSEVAIDKSPTGVSAIDGDAEFRCDVFNAQGIRVLRNADSDMIKRLPAGIYIFAGKKIVVK